MANIGTQIIGIDSGSNGAVAVYSDRLYVYKMPRQIRDLIDLFRKHEGKRIAYVEKVTAWHADIEGKQFNIGKLLQNYNTIINALELENIEYIEVHPKTWQSAFSVKKKEDKKDRKNRYKKLAQKLYPEQKAFLWNADAILILHYARMLNEMSWKE